MVKTLFNTLALSAYLLAGLCIAQEVTAHEEESSHPFGYIGPKLASISEIEAGTELANLLVQAASTYNENELTAGLAEIYLKALEQTNTESDIRDWLIYLAANSALLAREPNKAKEIVDTHSFTGNCEAHCYKKPMLLGQIEFEVFNYSEASHYFQQALSLLSSQPLAGGIRKEKAQLLSTYGFVMALLGEHEQAEATIEEAENLASDLNDESVHAWVFSMQANFQAFSGELIEAREKLVKAAALFELSGDALSQADVLINLATLHKLLGDYQQGIAVAQKALGLLKESGNPIAVMGSVYDRLANLYQIIGDHQRANQLFQLALEHELSDGSLDRAMRLQGQIASNLRELNRLPEAEAMHRESLEYFIGHGDIGETIVLKQELALDLIGLGRLEEATYEIETAISQRSQAPGFVSVEELNLVYASLLAEESRFDEAKNVLESSLAEQSEKDAPLGIQITYGLALMKLLNEMGDLDQAIEQGHKLIAHIQDVRAELEIRRLGPAWSRRTHEAISGLAGIYMQRYSQSENIEDAIRAFEILESGQANALRNQITNSYGRQNETEKGEQELELEQRLTVIANKRASAEPGSTELATLTAEYYQELELLEALRDKSFSNSSQVLGSLTDLQTRIPQDSLALRFYCPELTECWMFSFDRSRFAADYLVHENFEALVITAHNNLKLSSASETELEKISSLLGLDRFKSFFRDYDRLFINADYPLNLLPFSALPLTREQRLIDRYALVNTPSLSATFNSNDYPDRDYSLELAVLADPEFSEIGSSYEVITQQDQDILRSWSSNRQRLPWSAEEAETLKELYQDDHLAVYTGEQANRANLLSETTRNARILHIASHAYFNQANPDLVGIAISPNKDQQGTGFITLNELLSYPLNHELVVISGCETGVGEYFPGEGDMSLARGFHAKGALQVLSTRWPVSDRASALFMRYFHEALKKEGLSAEFALVSAQKSMKQNPRYESPFYWGGYVLSSTALK